MLGVKTYSKSYFDSSRARVEASLAAYRVVALNTTADADAQEAFEVGFFNDLTLLLDYLFVHRLRTLEGKDGNPMNEVRVICQSLLEHGGVMTADKAIKLVPAKSVLGIEYGSEIAIHEADFVNLSAAYFGAVESAFT